jgi:hypothetical protein
MKFYYKIKRLRTLLLLTPGFLASHAQASFYPPDYVIQSSCQTQGPVEVCAINQQYGQHPRLSFVYRGELMAAHWGQISAQVKLNGRQGLFKMTNQNYAEHLMLNDPRSYLCWTFDSNNPPAEGDRPGQYPWCATSSAPGGGGLVWEVEPAPAQESEIFFFARNQFGRANAWDLEVSFESDSGEADRRSYVFRFEP